MPKTSGVVQHMNTQAFMDLCAEHGWTMFGQYWQAQPQPVLIVGCLRCHREEEGE